MEVRAVTRIDVFTAKETLRSCGRVCRTFNGNWMTSHPLWAFFYFMGLPAAAHFGLLMLPFGEGLNAPPSNEDIAAVAAGVLEKPDEHIGKRYRPTGPKLISGHDAAEVLGRVLGRKVSYRDVPTKMFVKAAKAMGLSNFVVAGVRHYMEEMRSGTYAVGASRGRPATRRTLRPFAETGFPDRALLVSFG